MKQIFILIIITLFITSCSTAPLDGYANQEVPIQEAIAQIYFAETQRAFTISSEMLTPYIPPEPTGTSTPTLAQESFFITPQSSTQIPSPTYSQPVKLLELSGTGAFVTGKYNLPKCWKAVYYWSASATRDGLVSMVINAHQTAGFMTLVDVTSQAIGTENLNGSVRQQMEDGGYYFSIKNIEEAWTLRLECQDNVAPIEGGMNITADGWYVSDNYLLPDCQNGSFSWGTHPDENGDASIHLYLCDFYFKMCSTLASEERSGLTVPLTGQVPATIQSGTYFIGADHTLQPWNISWECKD